MERYPSHSQGGSVGVIILLVTVVAVCLITFATLRYGPAPSAETVTEEPLRVSTTSTLAPAPHEERENILVSAKGEGIVIESPVGESMVASPLPVHGKAPGTWFFEASFPLALEGSDGKLLGYGVATAEEEWMTEELVQFSALISFATPTTAAGTLILRKDNPSGLVEYDDELHIPLRFSP